MNLDQETTIKILVEINFHFRYFTLVRLSGQNFNCTQDISLASWHYHELFSVQIKVANMVHHFDFNNFSVFPYATLKTNLKIQNYC